MATAAVAPSCGNAKHATKASFVGSASDGTHGVAMQRLEGGRPLWGGPSPPEKWPEPDATANKTWLMFESVIVAAGEAEIPSKGAVVTSVEQTQLNGAVYVGDAKTGALLPAESERAIDLSAAGAWVLHNGVGYLLPQTVGAVAHISNANKTGDWSSLGVRTGSVTVGVFDLYIVQKKEYIYMILPVNATVSGMPAALAVSGGYSLVGGGSSGFRAALDPTGDVLLGAVWAEGGKCTSNNPVLVVACDRDPFR